jgi:hypothetical protein
MLMWGALSDERTGLSFVAVIVSRLNNWVGRSVKLLLAFASAVIPGLSPRD